VSRIRQARARTRRRSPMGGSIKGCSIVQAISRSPYERRDPDGHRVLTEGMSLSASRSMWTRKVSPAWVTGGPSELISMPEASIWTSPVWIAQERKDHARLRQGLFAALQFVAHSSTHPVTSFPFDASGASSTTQSPQKVKCALFEPTTFSPLCSRTGSYHRCIRRPEYF